MPFPRYRLWSVCGLLAASSTLLIFQAGCSTGTAPNQPAAKSEVRAQFQTVSATAPAAKLSFGTHIQPIISEHCYHCHGPDAGTRKADLRLDQFASATQDRGGYAAIDEEERFLIREERFLVDQYGPRMHPVPLSSVSPRPPGHGHSPPNTAPMHAHSPRRRRNAGRAAAPPAGGMLSQQAQGQAQPRGRTPASFASYDEAAMWLGARPRVLTAPA